jgi:hypothetical protein
MYPVPQQIFCGPNAAGSLNLQIRILGATYLKGLSYEMDSNDFITQKVYFSRLMRVCVGLTQVSLLLIGQQGFVGFFRYRPLLPIGWRIEHILRQRRRKTTNTATTVLSSIQTASQYTFINSVSDPY